MSILTRFSLALTGLVTVAFPANSMDQQPANWAYDPILISFDGMEQLAGEAGRQRLLSQELGFTVTVDEAGNASDCKLTRKFRRKATEIALCRPLLKHLRFEPARDAAGNPVVGKYSGTIDFNMWMKSDGYLEPEYRN